MEGRKKKGILVIVFILGLLGGFSKLYQITMEPLLVDKGLTYLESALNKSENLLLTLSGIKASIAIIEGSSIGVSFGAQAAIQLGDGVQSIYDAVDLMWKSSILGLIVIKIQEILLTIFSRRIIDYILMILSGGLLFLEYYKGRKEIITTLFRKSGRILIIFLLVAYIFLPINILILGKTSKFLEEKYRKPVVEKILIEKTGMDTIRERLEGDLSGVKLGNLKEDILELMKKIEVLGGETMKLMVILVTLYLLDGIVLPLGFVLISYYILKGYLRKER